jgi:hypothetical protein
MFALKQARACRLLRMLTSQFLPLACICKCQDYMLFDPFLYHGMAEMHDRHREMRLDVDNMSYEVKRGYMVHRSISNVPLC